MKTKSYPLTEQIIAFYGLKLDQLIEIYSGKNHCCRCGCGGRYFKKDDKMIGTVLSRLERMMRDNCKNSEEADFNDFGDGNGCVNIPYGLPHENKCYCLYFELADRDAQ